MESREVVHFDGSLRDFQAWCAANHEATRKAGFDLQAAAWASVARSVSTYLEISDRKFDDWAKSKEALSEVAG